MATAIPKGSTVLITGVNGYIASHLADQLLSAGYNVRGTVRNASRTQWIRDLFDEKYGLGRFETVVVAKVDAEGAWDEAVKGVSGIAHVATNVSLSSNPHEVIPETVSGTLSLLRAASLTKGDTPLRFVYTSSSSTTGFIVHNKPRVITTSTWNEEAPELAWAPPPYTDQKKWAVYATSKMESEKACFKFAKDLDAEIKAGTAGQKRRLVVNSVLPCVNFGPALHDTQSSETLVWMRRLVKGDTGFIKDAVPPQWFVDARDSARLHVAALTDPNVVSERIFAYSETFSWSRVLAILRRLYPAQEWPEGPKDEPEDLSTVEARSRSVDLLKGMGREGFIGLEESVKASADLILKGQ